VVSDEGVCDLLGTGLTLYPSFIKGPRECRRLGKFLDVTVPIRAAHGDPSPLLLGDGNQTGLVKTVTHITKYRVP